MSNNSNTVGFFDAVYRKGFPASNLAESYFHFGGISGKLGGNQYKLLNPKQSIVGRCPKQRRSRFVRIARFVMEIFKLLSFLTVIIPLAMLKIKVDNRKGCQYTIQSKVPLLRENVPFTIDANKDGGGTVPITIPDHIGMLILQDATTNSDSSDSGTYVQLKELLKLSKVNKSFKHLADECIREHIKQHPQFPYSAWITNFDDYVKFAATYGMTHLNLSDFRCEVKVGKDYGSSRDNYFLNLHIKYPDFLKSLTTLDLSSCDISSQGIAVLAESQPKLTSLSLQYCDEITDADLKIIAEKFPKLETLILHGCEKITDSGIKEIAKHCPELKTLDLWDCKKITDSGIKEIANNCLKLKTLNLWGCEKIIGSGVIEIANHCPELEDICLRLTNVSDDGIIAIASKCTQLKKLELSMCGKITDRCVSSIAANCTQLKKLDLSYCRNLTDAGLQKIADGLSNLESLDIGYNKKLTDAGLGEIVKNLNDLKRLNIGECKQVTDAGLTHVLTNCPNLSELGIAGCPLITASAVQSITQTHPKLKIK